MVKKKLSLQVVIVIVFIFIAFNSNLGEQSIVSANGGESGVTCFDYIDNDNDGSMDIQDKDCRDIALLDSDNDGIANYIEWEQNTAVFG